MARYGAGANNITPTAGNDNITIIGAAAGNFNTIDVLVGGLGTASAVGVVAIQRTSTGTTAVAMTLNPMSISSPAVSGNITGAAMTLSTAAWTNQPTAGVVLLYLPVNNNGGVVRWLAAPGEEIYVLGAATTNNLSLRQTTGTGVEAVSIVIDQV